MLDTVKLERVLGIHFSDKARIREAFTHSSYSAEHGLKYSNERLEFLGDSVVQITITEFLYHRYPELQEGTLTQIRSALVNQDTLSALARDAGLGQFMLLGRGEAEMHGNERDSTLCDVFEAVTGAIYLECGLETARKFFLDLLLNRFPEPAKVLRGLNPKGELQEFTQHLKIGMPRYSIVSVTGPGHALEYEVEAFISGIQPVRAKSTSRKLAEAAAAREALKILREKYPGIEM